MTVVEPEPEIADLVEAYFRDDSAVGLAVATVVDGRVRIHCRGPANPGGDPIGPDTVFEVGSLTEIFTATALADLAIRGEVGLDDPARGHLPEGAETPDRGGPPITLRHLATRTSGLPALPDNFAGDDFDESDPYAGYDDAGLLDALARARLLGRPGMISGGGSFGFAVLGRALAEAAGFGADAGRLLAERVAGPLGLVDTRVALDAGQVDRLAAGHAGGEPVPRWEMGALAAAGGLHSTPADLARFAAASLDPGSAGPLGPALALTQEVHAGAEPPRPARRWLFWLATVLAAWSVVVGGLRVLAPGAPDWLTLTITLVVAAVLGGRLEARLFGRVRPAGLGWKAGPLKASGRRALWNSGATGGHAGFVGIAPEAGVGVVVLANADEPLADLGLAMLDALASARVASAPPVA